MRAAVIAAAVVLSLAAQALAGCTQPGAAPTSPPTATATPAPAFAVPTAPPSPTITPPPAPTRAREIAMRPGALPLARPGPYFVGKRSFQTVDAARSGRRVEIVVWYPAQRPPAGTVVREDPADRTGAPYPVLLVGREMAAEWLHVDTLASHGFVVVGIGAWDGGLVWGNERIDFPLDLLFALDQLGAAKLPGFEAIGDVGRTGAVGYSTDGYTALVLGGARVDPESYLARCAGAPGLRPPLPAWWVEMVCAPASTWASFAARAGDGITRGEGGMWKPMTDQRIRAVMPMAPEGAWLFGKRGLAASTKPTLIIGAGSDDICLYDQEAAVLFQQLGSADKAMITLVGKGHMTGPEPEQLEPLLHFAVAFFGFHLQGRTEYRCFLSEEFVGQYSDLVWGVALNK